MTEKSCYKIFLSLNFTQNTDLIVEVVESEARARSFDVEVLAPGGAAESPAEAARTLLERGSIEGLLALVHQESSWVSDEIGMAYAYHLPVYVVFNTAMKMEGIAKLITSMKEVDIFKPAQLRPALKDAFKVLRQRIEENRKRLPELPLAAQPVVRLSWPRFWDLVTEAHKQISMDVDPKQKGYKPTLILGISRGGIIVADILSRLAGDKPLGLLEADRATTAQTITFRDEPTRTLLRQHLNDLGPQQQARILVVDDVTKSGRSLQAAVSKVNELLEPLQGEQKRNVVVESLVLVAQGTQPPAAPTYSFDTVPEDVSIILPYGLG